MDIDVSRWKFVGETKNSKYYEVEPGVLAILPHPGTFDTEADARENVDFQHDYFRKVGGGCTVIFFERMAGQDKDARRVFQETPIPSIFFGAALVGGTLLSRAMGSFFLGLAKPRIPTKFFGSTDEAIGWSRARIAQARAASTGTGGGNGGADAR